mgnify:CR=1 FL=1
MKRFILIVLLSVFSAMNVFAQIVDHSDVEMADQMRAEGKIYVVVAVVLIVFIGLILYLISLDRKISMIEKEKGNL